MKEKGKKEARGKVPTPGVINIADVVIPENLTQKQKKRKLWDFTCRVCDD
jgi:hypothetical protein